MAETWDDLEPLRTSREDLFSLALKLRGAGLKASPAQLVEAHDMLLGLRLAGALPADPLQWAGYLAPIFCRSAAEQDTFHRLFPDWAKSQGGYLESLPLFEKGGEGGFHADTTIADGGKSPLTPLLQRGEPVKLLSKLMLGLPVLLVLWLVAILMFGTKEEGQVIIPAPPTTPQDIPTKLLTLRRSHRTPQQTLFPSRPPEPDIAPQLPIGTYDFTSQQLAYFATGAPLAVFVLWLVWGIIARRTVLTKQPAEHPCRCVSTPLTMKAPYGNPRITSLPGMLSVLSWQPEENPNRYWVKGTEEGLFRPADFNFAGAKFREPVSQPTRRIHLAKTLAATVRKAGLFSPVYRRRRRHPEHLVLIDRASLPSQAAYAAAPAIPRDHLAAYGEALIGQFRAEQVITHVYYFNRDPRRCRNDDSSSVAMDLAALEARHGACRLLVLSDAAGLFESLSGHPVVWLDEFARWPLRVLLTPKPVDEWAYPEGTLALNGFAVAPVHPRSLALLAELWLPLALREDSTEATLQQVRLLAPLESRIAALPETLKRYGNRWLEPISHDSRPVSVLLSELRHYLREEGWLLLQALAVYPEPSWPLTLYVDWVLNGPYIQWKLVTPTDSDTRRTLRLLSLSRLPWLRHGRMPDYLRLALVRSLPMARRRHVTAIYRSLQAAREQEPHAIALSIGPPPKRSFHHLWRGWKKPHQPLVDDRIFAKVLLGGKPCWLDVELPDVLTRLMPGTRWNDVVVRLLAGFAAAVLWSMLFYTTLNNFQTPLNDWLAEQELARHGSVQVKIIKAPNTDWLEGPLVDALTGGGFAPRIEDPPPGSDVNPVVGRNKSVPAGVSGELAGRMPETVATRPYSGLHLRPELVWQGRNVIQVGSEAAAAGRWIAQRLRYIDYGREVLINPNPPSTDAAASSVAAIGPNEVTVWLADVPQAFQDSLAGKPPPVFIEPDMVVIPAGQFSMGSPSQETGRFNDEGPQHTVKVAQFALGRTEVTFGETEHSF